MILTLTTEHPSSSYGKPVLLIDDQAYGPADLVGSTTAADKLINAVRSFLEQWKDGPQLEIARK